MTQQPREDANRPNEGKYPRLERAIAILDRLFREGRVSEQQGMMILIDSSTDVPEELFEIFEVRDGYDASQRLLSKRQQIGLPANDEARNQFASLPLERTRLEDFLVHMGIVRSKVEGAVGPKKKKK